VFELGLREAAPATSPLPPGYLAPLLKPAGFSSTPEQLFSVQSCKEGEMPASPGARFVVRNTGIKVSVAVLEKIKQCLHGLLFCYLTPNPQA